MFRMTKRIEYIDTVKGFAIILMVFGHMKFHNFNWFIYAFHMPLFFILSGYFFNPDKSVCNRVRKLLVPYLVTSVILIIIEIIDSLVKNCLFHLDYHYNYNQVVDRIFASFWGAVKPVGIGEFLFPEVGPIWFLLALMIGIFLLQLLFKIENLLLIRNFTCFGCFGLAVLGWLISLGRGQMPFSINQSLLVPLFLMIGMKLKYDRRFSITKFIVAIIMGSLLLVIQKNVRFMSLRQMECVLFPVYIVGSISISYVVIVCFKFVCEHCKLTILSKVGSITLWILCIHSIDIMGIQPKVIALLSESGLLIEYKSLVYFLYQVVVYLIPISFILRKKSYCGKIKTKQILSV